MNKIILLLFLIVLTITGVAIFRYNNNDDLINWIEISELDCNSQEVDACFISQEITTTISQTINTEIRRDISIDTISYPVLIHQNPLTGVLQEDVLLEYISEQNTEIEKYYNLRDMYTAATDNALCVDLNFFQFIKSDDFIKSKIYPESLQFTQYTTWKDCNNQVLIDNEFFIRKFYTGYANE